MHAVSDATNRAGGRKYGKGSEGADDLAAYAREATPSEPRRRLTRVDVALAMRRIHRQRCLTSSGIHPTLERMRTTLDLPEELVESARKALGFKSKSDTIIVALRELVRRHRVEELKGLLGRVELDVDVERSRRRPRR